MRKILYICLMLIFTLYIETSAQILGDNNWNATPLFIDNFNVSGRSWQANWVDIPNARWRAYSRDAGVIHGDNEHQVYQKENCVFNDTDETMELWATYVGGPMNCTYPVPPGYSCDPNHPSLYYYSGEIDALGYPELNVDYNYFTYGYFEIRCKLPVHRGAFPAFWLWGGGDHYEEIDIFEYSWQFTGEESDPDFGSPRIFTTGLYFNDNENIGGWQYSYARNFPEVPIGDPDLSEWHTLSCEWSPERVIWYFDGDIVNEHFGATVPYRPMTLKANYALDDEVLDEGIPRTAYFPDKMTIGYIKVHKLKCDCVNPATIPDTPTLTAFTYEVKQSISIGSSGNTVTVPNSTKVVFRATDYIEITQNFELPAGSEMELITHPCPE
jgi:hypothetical protein